MQNFSQMEINLGKMDTSHGAAVKEMDKGYKSVERLKLDMER